MLQFLYLFVILYLDCLSNPILKAVYIILNQQKFIFDDSFFMEQFCYLT